MSSSTTVSQPSSENSKKDISTSSSMLRFKKFKSSTNTPTRDKKFEELKSKEETLNENKITEEVKSEKLKDKRDTNNNIVASMHENKNQITCNDNNKLVVLKDLIELVGDLVNRSYNNLLEIPTNLMNITRIAYEEGLKCKDMIEELSNIIVSRLWNISVRRISAKNLKNVNMSLYMSSPPRKAYGSQGALNIWNAYGIWTLENFEQKVSNLVSDLEEICKNADEELKIIINGLVEKLRKDLQDLANSVSTEQKQKKIEKMFCSNLVRSISLYKEVSGQINRDGFDHKTFANQFFNETSLYPQHNASSKIQEWSDSIMEFVSSNSMSSLLPTSGDEINKIIPHEYQTMIMSSYSASKLEYDSTPPKILTTTIFQSALFRKLILACLVNKLIENLSNSANSNTVEISRELLKDSVKCIVASLFKNIYKPDTKISKEFVDAYHSVKSSLESKNIRS